MSGAITLRPYQDLAIAGLREAFRTRFRAPLLVLPTAGGKTIVFSFIAAETARKGKRVLILAHRRELIRQASRKLGEAGVMHGIIAPGFSPTRDLVQVASVQTLARRLADLPAFDLIVIDEAHHATAGQWARIIAAQPSALILGVTATPERLDGKGLGIKAGGCFDRIVVGPTMAELIDGGFLSPVRVYAPAEAPDLQGVRVKVGDYDAAALDDAMNVATVTGDAVAHYRRHADGLPAIAFCISVRHAQDVATTFRGAGYRAVCGHGGMSTGDRDAAIGGLETGRVQVLTTCDLVSEGLDVPAVGAVILLRPTKSLGLFLQQVGRGLRVAEGKPHLVVLDHAGNTIAHGMPDAPREWSLDGRPRREAAPATWRCPECMAVQRPAPVCVACGFVVPVDVEDEEREARQVTQVDGELQEVDRARINALRAAPLRDLLATAQTRAELAEIARARGFKPGWAWHVMRDRAARGGVAA